MKNRIVIDLSIFDSIVRQLKGLKRDLAKRKETPAGRIATPQRKISDKIHTPAVLKILKVTPATLMNYEKKGLIRFLKEGRNKVYSESEILEFKKLKGRSKRLSKGVLKEKFRKTSVTRLKNSSR